MTIRKEEYKKTRFNEKLRKLLGDHITRNQIYPLHRLSKWLRTPPHNQNSGGNVDIAELPELIVVEDRDE